MDFEKKNIGFIKFDFPYDASNLNQTIIAVINTFGIVKKILFHFILLVWI